MNILTMSQIHLSFGPTVALAGVDVSIDAGEMVALTGRSGSGKSSLLNIASGALSPNTGGVAISGQSLLGQSAEASSVLRRDHVGFIFQNLNLLGRISVGDNVMLPLEFADVGPQEAQRRARAELERDELADHFDAFPNELSGGEQQRVGVARALVTRPSLLLADEPTSALDPVTAEMVMLLIRRAVDEDDCAALVVTHQPAQAAWADRVIHLRDGQIATVSSGLASSADAAAGNGFGTP